MASVWKDCLVRMYTKNQGLSKRHLKKQLCCHHRCALINFAHYPHCPHSKSFADSVLSALLNALKAEYENVLPIKNLETQDYSSLYLKSIWKSKMYIEPGRITFM